MTLNHFTGSFQLILEPIKMQSLMRTVQRGAALAIPKLPALESVQTHILNPRGFHSLSKTIVPQFNLTKNTDSYFLTGLLRPIQPVISPACGMKYKVRLKLRCKDCYFCWVQGRLHVRCETHPRHKQAAIVKPEKKTWILTSVSQCKKRPW